MTSPQVIHPPTFPPQPGLGYTHFILLPTSSEMDHLPTRFPQGKARLEDDNQVTGMIQADIFPSPHLEPRLSGLLDPLYNESYLQGVVYPDDIVVASQTARHISSTTDPSAQLLLRTSGERFQMPVISTVSTCAGGLDVFNLSSMPEFDNALLQRQPSHCQLLPLAPYPTLIQYPQQLLVSRLLQQLQQLQQLIAQQQNQIQLLQHRHRHQQQQQQQIECAQPITVHQVTPCLQQQTLPQQLNPLCHVMQQSSQYRTGEVTWRIPIRILKILLRRVRAVFTL